VTPRLNRSIVSILTITAQGLLVSANKSKPTTVPSAATRRRFTQDRGGDPRYEFRCSSIALFPQGHRPSRMIDSAGYSTPDWRIRMLFGLLPRDASLSTSSRWLSASAITSSDSIATKRPVGNWLSMRCLTMSSSGSKEEWLFSARISQMSCPASACNLRHTFEKQWL